MIIARAKFIYVQYINKHANKISKQIYILRIFRLYSKKLSFSLIIVITLDFQTLIGNKSIEVDSANLNTITSTAVRYKLRNVVAICLDWFLLS